MGRELEDNWIAALMGLIKRKDQKFKSSGFEKHDRNWLLAYDNWRPHPSNLNDLEERFRLSMRNNHALFGRHAFRKSLAWNQDRRSLINISLFDIFSTLFSVTPEKTIGKNAKEIIERAVELVNDEACAYTSTNSTNQVKSRFNLTMEALGEFQELEFLK